MRDSKEIEERLRLIAKEKHGRLLQILLPIRRTSKVTFQCQSGHQWPTRASFVLKGSWCPRCAASARAAKRRLDICDLRQLAATRRGKLLSSEYCNALQKLRWQCAEGHAWSASTNNVKAGYWCPICQNARTNKAEIFAKQFRSHSSKEQRWVVSLLREGPLGR